MTGSIPVASGSIFISYRREETAFAAGWLSERLVAHFGKDQVFKDVDSIQLGDDFADMISAAVGNCNVLLAIIGGRWLTIMDNDGRRRLDDPHDFVRQEIETALKRDVRVIPVLIEGTRMPNAAELPASLAKLVHRHGLELSANRFDYDMDRLVAALNRILTVEQAREVVAAIPADEASSLVKEPSVALRAPFTLAPDEKAVIAVHKHPASLIGPVVAVLAALTIAGALTSTVLQQNLSGLLIVWSIFTLLLLWLFWKAAAWSREYFIVTSQRVLWVSGIFRRAVDAIPLAKVTDLSYRRTYLGRVFGYGNIIVEAAGAGLRSVDHIPYPEQVFLELSGLLFDNVDD